MPLDEKEEATDESPKDVSGAPRRQFLRAALAVSVILAVGGIASVAKSLISPSEQQPTPPSGSATATTSTQGLPGGSTTSSALAFPKVKVANLTDLAVGKPLSFNYPLEETPNLLVKLGVKGEGGVGPDSDIVAFSQICQHLGCVYGFVDKGASPACDNTFKASGPAGYCCCHGSIFDLTNKGSVLDGPSPRPVPQVTLEVDAASGDIYATGMSPPSIFGHSTGSSDVSNDLRGGTLVS